MICPVCGGGTWNGVYEGMIRHGKDESRLRSILECNGCGIQRLNEFYDSKKYATGEYRDSLNEKEWDYELHDAVQKHILNELPSLRHKVVVDVGCGRGSFLDMISGQAARVVGVEPNVRYHDIPYKVYSYASAVLELADIVVSFDVIEHTDDPVEFLKDLKRLMTINGRIFVVTPNREEILFKLLPEYKEFRYQTVHNWYFDYDSLFNCAMAAGLKVINLRTIHRYGIGNTFGWLLEKKPVGDKKYPFLDKQIDELWRAFLNKEKLGEALLIECGRWE